MRAYLLTAFCALAVACGTKSASTNTTPAREPDAPAEVTPAAKAEPAKAEAKTEDEEPEDAVLDTGTPFSEEE